MKILINLLLLLIGCGFLVWAINSVDIEKTLELLIHIKFGFLALLFLYSLITWLDNLSWKYNFPVDIAKSFTNQKLWVVRLIGDAYNTITPLGTMGGEPVKAYLLKENYGISLKQTISSLVINRTTFLTALILFCIPGIFFILNSTDIPSDFKNASLLGLASFTIIIFLFFIFQITGALGKICQWLISKTRKPVFKIFLENLIQLNKLFSVYYQNSPKRIFISIFYALSGWVLGVGEVYLIFYFLGFSPSIRDIWIIESMAQLVRAGSFFIPFSIGVLEGGFVIIFSSLGYSSSLGLAVAIISRIKQLTWVAFGLSVGWFMSFKTTKIKSDSTKIEKNC